MYSFKEIYHYKTTPYMNRDSIIQGENYRITVLTDGLFRLEYSENGVFTDQATQMAINRYFEKPDFRVIDSEESLEIYTSRLYLKYNKQSFSSYGLRVEVISNLSNYDNVWHYGDKVKDLGGTARTLDKVDGACPLEHGLMSRFGFSVIDDSRTALIEEDGRILPRPDGIKDIYFFGYGHDYKECLSTFYHLCGKMPMVPRYVLGNWWSRYYEYSEESFCQLIRDFEKEEIPFSVAVVDMDWHIVDIDPKYGSGWTGYTWNKKLFPNPERFIRWLHDRGMKVTLNMHPAAGVRAYEECYPEFAEYMGVDQEAEEPVVFNITDPKFLEGYFKYAHYPLEKQGVDFWWIDWQQGNSSDVKGIDPLWMLNHYHYLDNGKDGRRPLIFSRYAGPGSHRYPIGFSGDTLTTWESLDFQPYFNATAANIGFGWWSHDIGGHEQGVKNDIMATRWLQLGVFSPVNRLHTAKKIFYGREPWRYGMEARAVMDNFLRLRHRLIPYLYTMNHRAYSEDLPIVLPMYYNYPDMPEAYEVKNQFYFGAEMIVAPITSPNIEEINMGRVTVWIPEGKYIDYFTGMVYDGGRMMTMYRNIHSIPVLVKAGNIIPETEEIYGNDFLKNPENIIIKVFCGDDGSFTMYEDDNQSEAYKQDEYVKTEFELKWNRSEPEFHIYGAKGKIGLIPQKRNYSVEFIALENPAEITVVSGGKEMKISGCYDKASKILSVDVFNADTSEEVVIRFKNALEISKNDIKTRVFNFLNFAEIEYELKDEIYYLVTSERPAGVILNQLQAMEIDRDLELVLSEMLTAQ